MRTVAVESTEIHPGYSLPGTDRQWISWDAVVPVHRAIHGVLRTYDLPGLLPRESPLQPWEILDPGIRRRREIERSILDVLMAG